MLFVIFALSITAVFWYFLKFLSPRCRNKKRTDFNGLIMTSQYIDLQQSFIGINLKILLLTRLFDTYGIKQTSRLFTIQIKLFTNIIFCTKNFVREGQMVIHTLKGNLKRNLQKHNFVYVYEVILNFIACLYFSLALIR